MQILFSCCFQDNLRFYLPFIDINTIIEDKRVAGRSRAFCSIVDTHILKFHNSYSLVCSNA